MILKNNTKRVLTISNVHIVPGVNVMDEIKADKLNKELTTLEEYLSCNILESMDKDVTKPVTNILTLESKDLKELIKNTWDLKKLESYFDEESASSKPRSVVLNVIEKQINKINEVEKKDK